MFKQSAVEVYVCKKNRPLKKLCGVREISKWNVTAFTKTHASILLQLWDTAEVNTRTEWSVRVFNDHTKSEMNQVWVYQNTQLWITATVWTCWDVPLKCGQGHWKWYNRVKCSEYYHHVKFHSDLIYSLQEIHNVEGLPCQTCLWEHWSFSIYSVFTQVKNWTLKPFSLSPAYSPGTCWVTCSAQIQY